MNLQISHLRNLYLSGTLTPTDLVKEGDEVAIVESMKMEIAVTATTAGKVTKVLCAEGMSVSAGQNLIVIAEE